MAIVLDEIKVISEGDVDKGSIDCTKYLDAGETFSGTVTLAEAGTLSGYDADTGLPTFAASSDLALSGGAVNSATEVVNDVTVAIGKALKFTISGQQSGNTYGVQITASTTSSRTKTFIVLIEVR